MRRDFAYNLALIIGVNVLVKPLYLLGVDVGVQNSVGTDEYGLYAWAFNFAFLFGVVHDFGLQNYNSVTLSKEPMLLRERLPLLLALKLVLSVAFFSLAMGAALAYGARGRVLGIVALAAAYHTALSILQLLRTNLGAQAKYRFNSLVSVADKALLVIGLGAVLLVPAWREWITIERFLLSQIAALVVTSAIVVWGTTLSPGQRWLRWDTQAARELLGATLPFALLYVVSSVFTRADSVMLEALHPDGLYQAGLYAGTYRLLDGFNMVGFLFATLLIPMLSKEVAAGRSGAEVLRLAGGIMVALGVGLATYTSWYAGDVVNAIYTEATAEWADTLAILMWAATATGLTYVYGSYLLTRERVATINWMCVGALLINVGLNVYLIPRYGARGAAAATVCTHSALALGEYLLCGQLTASPGRSRRWWPLLAYGLLVLATAYVLHALALHWLLALVIHALASLAAGLATGLIAEPRAVFSLLAAKVKG